VIALACEVVLAVVLGTAAVSKLRGPAALREFRDSLVGMRLVPRRAAGPVAAAVGLGEAVVAVALCVPVTAGAGLVAAGIELAVLTAGVGLVVRRGSALPCRCFGPARRPLGRLHLVRNGALLAVAALGLVSRQPVPEGPAVVIGVAAGVVVGVIGVAAEGLVELFAPLPAPAGADRPRSAYPR